jgi:DNA repair protein RadC
MFYDTIPIMEGNLHSGHRERMMEKFVNAPDGMASHELLEILLFSVMPRKDTNALAHKLLLAFGDLDRLFSASPKELMAVDGVGKRIASHIASFGKIMDLVLKRQKPSVVFDSFDRNKAYVIDLLSGLVKEKFYIILIDKDCKEITKIEFTSFNELAVEVDTSSLARAIAVNTPRHALICHNHTSSSLIPSRADDIATAKIYMLCKIHGVNLIDHIIVSGKHAYGYFIDGRLKNIKDKVDSDDFSKKI